MSLGRFTGQVELKKIYDAYVAANPNARPTPILNDVLVTTANDGAGVFFTPDEPLFGDEESRKADGTIAKQISQRIIDCLGYYLALGISAKDVPSTMRFCMSICHDNSHWTGLVVELDNFREIYESFDQYAKDNYFEFGERGVLADIVIHNRAKNAVLHRLGAIDDYANKILDEDTKTRFLFDALKTDKKSTVTINHFDSLNSRGYLNRIREGLEIITDRDAALIDLAVQTCSYQRGNTCGDHTIYNIFSFAHFGETPTLNQNDSNGLTSQDLRTFTDQLDSRWVGKSEIKKQATRLVKAASAEIDTPDKKPVRDKYILVETTTADVVLDIHKTTKLFTPALIHYLGTNKSSNKAQIIAILDEFNASQNIVTNKIACDDALLANIKKLQALFIGEGQFTQLESSTDDEIAFGALAYCAAANICSEIEHQQLRAEQTECALLKQESALEEYSKHSSSPERDTSDTPDGFSPTLFGTYSSAATTRSTTPTSNSDTEIDLNTVLADLQQTTNPKPVVEKRYAGKIAGAILGVLLGAAIGVTSFLLAPFTLGGSLIIGGALVIGLAALGGGVLGFGVGFGIDRWRRGKDVVAQTPITPPSKNGSTAKVYHKRAAGADLLPRKSEVKESAFEYPPRVDAPKNNAGDAPQGKNENKLKR